MQKAVFLSGLIFLIAVIHFYYLPTDIAPEIGNSSGLDKSESQAVQKAFVPSGSWPQYRKYENLPGSVEKIPEQAPELIWRYNTGFPLKSGPLVNSGKAFVVAKKGLIVAVDLIAGKKLWQHCYCEPVTASGLLLENASSTIHFIGTQKGNLYATDAANGNPLFSFKTQDKINGAPAVFKSEQSNSQMVVFGSYDCFIYSIDPITGKMNWKLETDNYQNGTPSRIGKNLFIGGCDGFLRAINPETGSQTFSISLGGYIPSSPACLDEMVYVALHEGEIVALDSSKKEIKWRLKPDEESEFLISPLVNDEFVIIASRKGKIKILDRETGLLQRSINHPSEIISEPVIDKKSIFLADSDGNLVAYDLTTGKKIWQKLHGASVEAPVALIDNALLVADMEGTLSLYGWKN